MRYQEILREFQDRLDNRTLMQVTKYVWDNTDWGGGDGESWYYEFHQDYPECDSEQQRINKRNCERAFKRWFKEQVPHRASDVYSEIMSHFKGNKIRLFREVTAPQNWRPAYGPNAVDPRQGDLFPDTIKTTPEFTHPGVFWSYDEGAAEAHWGRYGSGETPWLIVGETTYDQIDWEATLGQNLSQSVGREKEVRLYDDADVDVISVKPRSGPRGWR